ncbi:MAG: hypothetical protein E7256_01445 [Lachnospiraceae bacterium]|nr:hypothetical protein [Lachnospiraceae bacterium]
MKEKIEQFANGRFLYDLPMIILSEDKLEITVVAGYTYQGSFTITNSTKTRLKGVLYSSSRLITFENGRFIGEENEIVYHVSAKGLAAQLRLEEEIQIVTDCGEKTIPVIIETVAPFCNSTLGKIENCDEFTNLAKCNWSEAKNIFKSPAFADMLLFHEPEYYKLYQDLSQSSSTSQSMEEFLVATGYKEKIRYEADRVSLSYELNQYNFMDKVKIIKKGWGYGDLRISTDLSFIELDRKILWVDSFNGDEYELGFVVKNDELKAGVYTGHIRLQSVTEELVIEVTIDNKKETEQKQEKRIHKAKLEGDLIQNYIDFRTDKKDSKQYAQDALHLLLEIDTLDKESTFLQLYRLHIYQVTDKLDVVREELARRMEKPEQLIRESASYYAFVLYLDTLVDREQKDKEAVCDLVREYYKKDEGDWLLFWMLLYLEKQYDSNPEKKFEDIKAQFYRTKIHTPILYYEAAEVLMETPSLLKELGSFEQQILNFAFRNHMMTKEVAMQFSYLALKEKHFTILLFKLLKLAYETYDLKEALQAICGYLIRTHRTEYKYFEWYCAGILAGLRIGELQEYYMYALDPSKDIVIDAAVLAYFSFNVKLPDRLKEYLFYDVVRGKEKRTAIYDTYRDRIREFALEQLKQSVINERMAVIYQDVCKDIEVNEEVAEYLPKVAFKYLITCDAAKVKAVCVIHKEIADEVITPVVDGQAVVDIYTQNVGIYLMDESQNRYTVSIPYTMRHLLDVSELLEECYKKHKDQPCLALHLSEMAEYYEKTDEISVELRKQVAIMPNLNPIYKKQFLQTLIYYYYDNYEGETLKNYLAMIDLHFVAEKDRIKFIEFMILRELFDVAVAQIKQYGYEKISVTRLVKLAGHLIRQEYGQEKNLACEITYYLYQKNQADKESFKFLAKNYNGPTKNMLDLWEHVREKEMDTTDLEERLLGQMLFTESYVWDGKAVFYSYYRTGFNKKLIRAYLSYCSYKYLIRNRMIEDEMFEIIRKELSRDDNEVCVLALIKYYSRLNQLTDSEINFIDYHLSHFEIKGIYLPFFKGLQKHMKIPKEMDHKVYVEYRANPEHKVILHYSMDPNEEEGLYRTEEMSDMCYGIFVKEFVLFKGETLYYYITEKDGENVTVIDIEEIMARDDEANEEKHRYGRLNEIIAARMSDDAENLAALLEEYWKMDYQAAQLFKPL